MPLSVHAIFSHKLLKQPNVIYYPLKLLHPLSPK